MMTTTAAAHRLSPMILWFLVLLISAWGGRALAEPLPRETIEFHVAPTGDDANPGTPARPFATLERARDAARAARRGQTGEATAGTPAMIRLAAGRYRRSEPLVLTARDSHTTFTADDGARVLLTGGRRLPRSWFQRTDEPAVLKRIIDASARKKVWQVDLRAHGITDYGKLQRRGLGPLVRHFPGPPPMQVYVGGERMILARWPNPNQHFPDLLHAYVRDRHGVVGRALKDGIVDPGPTAADPEFLQRGPVFRYAYDRADRWTEAEDVWLDGIFNRSWEWSYNRVATINPAAKTITMRYGEPHGIAPSYAGDFHFADNLLEDLDRPV